MTFLSPLADRTHALRQNLIDRNRSNAAKIGASRWIRHLGSIGLKPVIAWMTGHLLSYHSMAICIHHFVSESFVIGTSKDGKGGMIKSSDQMYQSCIHPHVTFAIGR